MELPGEEIPEYAVDLPEDLSSFTIAIWGENYQLPMEWQAFEDMGWDYQGDGELTVDSESYLQGEIFEQSGNSLTVDIMNPRTTAQPVSDAILPVYRLILQRRRGLASMWICRGGITLQKSTLEEAVKAYGEPVDRFEGEKRYC